ncbi:hypothetical protein DMENIID0001_163180 [Sergentomyia squamirostris]
MGERGVGCPRTHEDWKTIKVDHEVLNEWQCSVGIPNSLDLNANSAAADKSMSTDVHQSSSRSFFKMSSSNEFWQARPPPHTTPHHMITAPVKTAESPCPPTQQQQQQQQQQQPSPLSPSIQHQIMGTGQLASHLQTANHQQQQQLQQPPTPGGSSTPDTKPTAEKLVNEFQHDKVQNILFW